MPVIGLLEGQRLRYRLGAPEYTVDAWNAYASGNVREIQRDLMTTDWTRLWLEDPASAKAKYFSVNIRSLDPDIFPTLETWLAAHGGIPANPNIQPDPPVTQNPNTDAAAEAAAEAARVTAAEAAAEAARVTAANAAYDAQARAWAEESARLAKLPRDPVIGPAFLPDPGEMPACTGRSGEVTCYDPASASQGGRGDDITEAVSAKATLLPLLALAAAWMVLK